MGTQITFRRGSNDPTSGSGITLAEPVFNTNLHTFHIGLGYGVTAEWVGAPISGLSADIAAGITYKIPTAAAVKNYISGLCFGNTGGGGGGAVSSVSGSGNGISVSPTTGAVVVSNTGVHSFNGLTGAVQGVSAAVAGTGISVSGATGAVTITNIGVQSFNGNTGAVTGASLGANTFTGTQTLTAGLTTSYLYASTGSTFASTLQVNGGATFSGRTDFAGNNNFATGLSAAGTLNTTGSIKFNGTTAKTITTTQAPLTISGSSSGAAFSNSNSIVFGVQTTDPLKLNSATSVVEVNVNNNPIGNPYTTGIKLFTGDVSETIASANISPLTYFTADRTLSIQDASGTIALTSQLMGAVNGSTAATTAVTSFNGRTGAVQGVSAAVAGTGISVSGATGAVTITNIGVQSFNGNTGAVTGVTVGGANTFTALNSFNAGISAAGGVTLAGTLQGTTASFTGLVSSTVGFSGSATNLVGNANGLTAGTASRVQIAEGAGSSYYLALAGGVGNTGIFVDTSAPRWTYNASTGSLVSTTGYVEAAYLYANTAVYSNSIIAYDPYNPIIINTPINDGTPQGIIIGDYNDEGNGTIFTLDDALTKIEISAVDVDCGANMNVKGGNDLRFYVSAGFTYVGFKAPLTPPNNIIWTLPSADGSANQVLTTNGSGTLSWSAPSGGGSSVTSFNGLTGAVTGVTVGGANTFTALNSFNAGISASGGVTFAGTFSGATGSFSRLLTASAGISAASGVTLAGTFSGTTGSFSKLLSLSGGLSASGDAIFQDPVYINSTLYTNNILPLETQINIAAGTGNVVVIGDYDGVSNSTFVYVRDNLSALYLSNPYGDVAIGDPNGIVSGYALVYNAAAGYLDGGSSSLTNFSTGSFSGLLTASAGISAAGGVTFGGTVASDTGYRITSNAIKAQTGTTYTFLESDNGKVLTFNNGSAVTVTIPTALPVGFNCTAIQLGAGQVGFTAASGLTLQSYGSQYRLIGQHASATIIEYSENIVNLSGNLVV